MSPSRAQILVVEDEGIVAADIRNRLRSLGYEVPALAYSGEEAIRKAAEIHPDLVLMDIVLSGEKDGVQVAQELRERLGIPVIYVTAYADDDTVQRAKLTEPLGYILKPFEEHELKATIESALYRHGMERRLAESQEWFSAALRSVSDAVIGVDQHGAVTFMNGAAERLTGWTLQLALGRDVERVFRLARLPRQRPADHPARRALRHDADRPALECRHVLIPRHGIDTPVYAGISLVQGNGGRRLGVVVAFRPCLEPQDTARPPERERAGDQGSRASSRVGSVSARN